MNTKNILVQKISQKVNTNHTTTTHYNNQGKIHDTILTKYPHPTRPNTTKYVQIL